MNLDTILPLLVEDPTAPLDVAEIALALAAEEFPTLDRAAYRAFLAALGREMQSRLQGNLLERTHLLCRYLFVELGFCGNAEDYYDPRNSYFNQVIDRRTGIPITLSILAMAVGQRAGLQVEGVGLPGHFIAKSVAESEQVLFDPFHGGRVLTPEDCESLVEGVTGVAFRATEETLAASPLFHIVVRMLSNLKAIYLQGSDFQRAVRILRHLRVLLPGDPLQLRDLGVSLLHAGRPGEALQMLEQYLHEASQEEDRAAVQRLVGHARQEIAKWN